MADEMLTMADIARLAQVKLPAVSNWRRRHKDSFPQPSRGRQGRDLFRSEDVAQWLDARKIARNDLARGELPDTTYGIRFRTNLRLPVQLPEAMMRGLWRQVERHRGPLSPAELADLVLGLHYLRFRDPDIWTCITRSEPSVVSSEIGHAARRFIRDLPMDYLSRAVSSLRSDARGEPHLHALVQAIDLAWRDVEASDTSEGWIFDQLLARFAESEGRRGAEYLVPPEVVRLMVEALAPRPGNSVLDPWCGAGGLLVGAVDHVKRLGHDASAVTVAGATPNQRSWWLTRMNCDLHGVAADIGVRPAMTLVDDPHRDRRFDVVLTNPPFNLKLGEDDYRFDRPWRYGAPPRTNANFAWLQHVISILSDRGRAAVLMPNAASSSAHPSERSIRQRMVEDGVVEAIIALPPRLFDATAVPVTLWIMRSPASVTDDDRVLFVDAHHLGRAVGRKREVSSAEIDGIIEILQSWQSGELGDDVLSSNGDIVAVAGLDDMRAHDFRLSASVYVAKTFSDDDSVAKIHRLNDELDVLGRRAVDVDARAARQLARVREWIP